MVTDSYLSPHTELSIVVPTPFGSGLVVVMQGNVVDLTCQATTNSLTAVEYEWRKLDESGILSRDSVLTLTYTNASSVSQGGYYWCIATSMFEQISVINISNAVLVVFAPSFIKLPQAVQTDVGESVVFRCSAMGFPKPAVEWKKLTNNNITLPGGTLPSLSQITYQDSSSTTSSTLNITSVDFDDFGHYTCVTLPQLRLPGHANFPSFNFSTDSSFASGSGSGLGASGIQYDSSLRTLTPVLSSGLTDSSLKNLTAFSDVHLLTSKGV